MTHTTPWSEIQTICHLAAHRAVNISCTHSHHDDIVQTALIGVARAARVDAAGVLADKALVVTIARRRAIDEARALFAAGAFGKSEPLSLDAVHDDDAPISASYADTLADSHDVQGTRDALHDIVAAFETLSPRERAMLLADANGVEREDIQATFGVSETRVRQLLANARLKVRRAIAYVAIDKHTHA